MFVDVNYSKRKYKPKFHLAKPNKKIISHISESFDGSLNIKLGNISELNFSIPYLIEDANNNLVRNEHIDTIKEKMLIRVTLGAYKEWFIVDKIEENSDESDIFIVTAFSLGYELKNKRVSGYVTESDNAISIINELLRNTSWRIDTIDDIFNTMYRSFDSGEDANALDCIFKWAETFNGVVVWDTLTKKISLKELSEIGNFRGLTVRHDRLINSLNKVRTTDEMITRLYVRGSEDLSINSVNPTGQNYIEDFSYFMHPFEVNNQGQVIKSSDYMSDELCLALLSHKRTVDGNAPIILERIRLINNLIPTLISAETTLTTLRNELDGIQQLLDLALSINNNELISQRQREREQKLAEIQTQVDIVEDLKTQRGTYENEVRMLQNQIGDNPDFTDELVAELDAYIIESIWRDDRYIDEEELYEHAIEKFDELRKPKVVVDISIDNLMDIIEEQYTWDTLRLGDFIKVKHEQLNLDYKARITEMTYDLENREVDLVISNTIELSNETEKLAQLLYESKSATSLVQNNKYKWDRISSLSDQVSTLITEEWDATKRKIIAGINNSVEVGKRGIIIKNPDFPDEVVIMQSGVIALSKDGGETWKTAITPDGIVAERLIGKIIAGNQLLITNSSGSFTMDDRGAIFNVDSFRVVSTSSSGQPTDNLVDRWQQISDFTESLINDELITPYEKKILHAKWIETENRYNTYQDLIDNFYTEPFPTYVQEYEEAYNELYTYLFSTPHGEFPILSPQSMNFTTQVLSVEFDEKFNNYDLAYEELDKQIRLVSKAIAESAKEIAERAQENIEEAMNDVAYKIEIHSSNGFIFKNGDIDTTITARVYRGIEDVTSTIPNTGFIWRKFDKDGIENIAWNNTKIGVGNVISVTNSDIISRSTFRCDVYLD